VTDLPEAASEEMLEDDDFLKKFHHALLEVHLEQGALVCPETGDPPTRSLASRVFPLASGRVGQGRGSRAMRSKLCVHACACTPAPPQRCLETVLASPLCRCCRPPLAAAAGRKFPVSGGIPNLLLTEDEC
jgi:uncharacterized protein YbaR (Trm112 family)